MLVGVYFRLKSLQSHIGSNGSNRLHQGTPRAYRRLRFAVDHRQTIRSGHFERFLFRFDNVEYANVGGFVRVLSECRYYEPSSIEVLLQREPSKSVVV